MVVVIYLWFFITTFINNGNKYIALSHGIQVILLCILMDIVTDNEDMLDIFLKVVRDITLIFYIINIVSIILFPNGIPSISEGKFYPWYIYGNVNATIKYVMPGLCTSLILDSKKNKTVSIFSLILIVGVIATALTVYFSATAVIADIIVVIWVLGYKQFKNKTWNKYAFVYIILFAFGVIVVFGSGGSNLLSYISSIFNKDVTLSGRTALWARAFSSFIKNPIYGYGYKSFYELERVLGNGYGCHNYYLDMLFQRGVIGLGLILIMFVTPIICCRKKKLNSKSVYLLIGICIAYTVMFLSEPFYDFEFIFIPMFYVLFSLSFKNKSRALIPKHIL